MADKENKSEIVTENPTEKREKKKAKKPKFFSRIIGFFKRKTAPAREFMRIGRPAAMIAEVILGAFFSTWIIEGYTFSRIPTAICYLIAAVIIVVASEILNLVLKIVFGAGKRCKSYFFIVAFVVAFSAIGANQMTEFFYGI